MFELEANENIVALVLLHS